VRFHAKDVSATESGGEYFQVSFDSEAPSDDHFVRARSSLSDRSAQFEDDDGGVCYIETHTHDTYTGQFRLRLIEFTRHASRSRSLGHTANMSRWTYDLDEKRFGEVQRIVHIVFGMQG
jgi:hypothetical protein